MTRLHVYEFDLDGIEEPEDLWTRLFFAWLKNLAEQNAMNQDRLRALELAITKLDGAVAKLLPEQSDEMLAAMKALQGVQDVWKQQSSRSLDNVEKMAVIAKQIVASQKSG